jgi:hypothetical protein
MKCAFLGICAGVAFAPIPPLADHNVLGFLAIDSVCLRTSQ